MGSYSNDYRRRSPRRDDHYRPNYDNFGPPPPPPADVNRDMYHFRGNAGDSYRPGKNDSKPRSNYKFNWKPKVSERPLLKVRNNQHEEQILGSNSTIKFRDLDQMTDSDEAMMEDSEDEEDARPSKRSKVDTKPGDADDKPKWSNPDPYTALPAPSETTGKKLDFVKLIRKARNETAKAEPETNAEDFISFSLNDDPVNNGPPRKERKNAPLHERVNSSSLSERIQNPVVNHNIESRADEGVAQTSRTKKRKRGDDAESTPKMKRTKGRGTSFYTDAAILDEWRADNDDTDATPWFKGERDPSPGVTLHKEIVDFHNWVKPKDHEDAVRADVINRLSTALNRLEPGEMKAFGSFGAGLYLPVGDMDLVFLTRSFQSTTRRGIQNVNLPLPKRGFWKFHDYIRMQDIARPGTLMPIAHAKVPIIKFVERVSGLKVDLSFNNDTGLAAIETFQKWKRQYPAMPMIVPIIKQFLMLRGLNDVAVGGLGGFSIICLVTSLIQHMPASGTVQNLGDLLLEFFNFYGNHFDRDSVAIRLDPPAYIDKDSYAHIWLTKEKGSRLSIIDPHRPENNISGGTHEIELILQSFSDAHNMLQERIDELSEQETNNFSLLEELVGGNFNAYDLQRDVLSRLYYGPGGRAVPSVIPPPPPPIREHVPPPPNRSSARMKSNGKDQQKGDRAQLVPSHKPAPWENSSFTKPQRRAMRIKTLRPDLASSIRGTLQIHAAVQLGGYKDATAMGVDLDKLEKEFRANLTA